MLKYFEFITLAGMLLCLASLVGICIDLDSRSRRLHNLNNEFDIRITELEFRFGEIEAQNTPPAEAE